MKVSTRPSQAAVRTQKASHRAYDVVGILLGALAATIVVALLTPDSGLLGSTLGALLTNLFGRVAWAAPLLLLVMSLAFLRGRAATVTQVGWGALLIFLATLGFFAVSRSGDYFELEAIVSSGGYVGAMVASAFQALLGAAKPVGMGAMGLIGLVLCINTPIRDMIAAGRSVARRSAKAVRPVAKEERRRLPEVLYEEPPQRPAPKIVEHAAVAMEVKTPEPKPRSKPKVTSQELQFDFDAEPTSKEGYQLPPSSLLAEPIMQPKRSQTEMQKQIETLEGTLEQFGIEAQVVEVATGPTVTRYEIQLGPGVRVNRITALADNIAMDLAASQVRVEAPIPGKAAIGVEVPNSSPSTVTLRELADDPKFKTQANRLWIALGKDVSGQNKYTDLAKMPHLLIGGATNSGKSIGLATLIMSLLMRNTPKDVRLVMIDPKRVELTLFDRVPHLMCPVIKDVKEAPGVLRAVWREMDRRYDLFSEAGVRNIDGWNAKASFADKLPYIVVVIDELADLMIQAQAEVETVIVRLAQLARAVGIHMVIATQRPSVDVITGLIKANIPSRLAFSVASAIDSRTILDQKGADSLIGKGDMLFLPIDANKPVRIQGCFVSEREIEAVCKFWRDQESPAYVLTPVDENLSESKREGGGFSEETDALWEDAVRWAVDRGEASTSMLQRKFSIGFQRASRLLDTMEERGIVGPRDGPRPRDVLVSPMDVDALFGKGPRYDVGRTIVDDGILDEA
jgi:S-DNA-T family DNA segregation ATPase FtsK/SpoIIIE